MLGLIIYSIASITASFTYSVCMLSVCRIFQGLGIGVGSVLPKAMARDVYTGSKLTETLSSITIVWTLTTIFAPLLGGYMQQYFGWRANFYAFFLYSLILLFLYWRFLPETNLSAAKEKPKNISLYSTYQLITKNKIFLSYSSILMLAFSALIAFSVSATFLLQNNLNVTPKGYGEVMMLIGAAYIAGNASSNFVIKKYNNTSIISFGISMVFLSSFIFLIISWLLKMTILTLVMPALLIVFGIGLMYSNCMAIILNIFPNFSGSASAILGSFLMLGSSAISVIVAHLNKTSQSPLAILISFISLAMALVYLCLNKTIKKRGTPYE